MRTAQRWAKRGLPVRRVGRSPKAPVVADSELVDAWVRHGGRIPLDALKTEAIIAQSKKLLTELSVSQRTLLEGLRSLNKQVSSLRALQELSRKAQSRRS